MVNRLSNKQTTDCNSTKKKSLNKSMASVNNKEWPFNYSKNYKTIGEICSLENSFFYISIERHINEW